uniref:Beta-1,4-mannan synthase n=1 Tax=Cyamopsis tetragonoloba TaxID=3832 RepID=A0A678NSM3_CYATE|nr:beta-1,4-mannan synthase [Cyamopsis tetragonoloba]APU87404.1 beta-1,4-mannan synthase [Cyamopsis tetragonoloba]
MDLAVRASLHGWEFVFVGDVKVSYSYLSDSFDKISRSKFN